MNDRGDAYGPDAASVRLPTDRYRIDAQLGVGGTATVYRAWDTHAEDWVAVKVLNPSVIDRPKMRRRFEIEALALQKLDHRNVIRVLDVDLAAEPPFLVMEIAEGGCLIDWIRTYGPLPPRMAVDAAIQVCKGVAVAHAQGIVHRDIKPHNVLMNHRGVCKLTDFGIAQVADESLTRTGTVVGTLGYIAPEQRSSEKRVDERVDVYAIGATFYTMLTGRVAADLFFAGQDPSMLEDVPDELRSLLLKATSYDPADRFPDVVELARALHAVRNELPPTPTDTPSLVVRQEEEVEPPPRPAAEDTWTEPTPAPVPRRSEPAEAPPVRGPRVVAVAAAALLVLVLALVASLLPRDDAPLRAQQAYHTVLAEQLPIVEDLAVLGADRHAVDRAWRALTEAKGAEARRRAAEAYVALLEREVRARAASPPVGQRAAARDARARLETILRARDRAAAARAASSGCGRTQATEVDDHDLQ